MRKRIFRRRSHGFTMLEMIVTGLVSVLLGAAMWTLLRTSYDNQYMLMNQNMVNTTSRQAVDLVADNIRGATTLTAGDGSSVTYTNSSGQAIHYWKSGTDLVKSINGSPTAGTAVISNVSALAFTFWTWNGTSWASASSATTPANVSAMDFAITLSENGSSRKISGSVKIRQK